MKNKAVILAAGIGSRLYPITKVMPKSLVKVCDKEILKYQIQGYLNAKIEEKDISIVTGYRTNDFKMYLDKNYPQVKIIENTDYLTTNNMYSLYLALNSLKDESFDYLFINNADCLYEEKMMFDFVNCDFENAIACEINSYIDESMKIITDEQNRIINIAKTISQSDAAGVSIDLYKYSKQASIELYNIVRDFIEVKQDLKQWTEVAFPYLFKKVSVYPFDIKHRKWVEVDNIDDLILADKKFSDFDYKSKSAYICDLDGTLFIGQTPIKDAVDFIKKNDNNFDFYFLTNNTSKTPQIYVDKLKKAGIKCDLSQITTPLYPLIDYIKEKGFNSVYVVANKEVKEFLKMSLNSVDFSFDKDKNQAIVLTYDTDITYEKLKNICILLNSRDDIEYLATHEDVFCPTEEGNIPDIGSFIGLIKNTVSKSPTKVFGKPSKNLIESIIRKYGKENIAIVGDRIYTDKKLADNSNIDFITVLSGETTRFDISQCDSCKYVLKTFGDFD